ncbi:MAG TPA: hypothetical protein VFX59_17430, partial [Polyangiales bacterium]|nr:hypothetical protein [Polyangiales bacterium]
MDSEPSSELELGAAPSELPPALPCTRESIAAAAPSGSPSRARFVLRPQDPARAGELGRACAISPLIAQVLLNRGIAAEAPAKLFLGPKLAHLTRPDQMADRMLAAERLAEAVRRRERIVVFGDYDVDGTTSAA